MPRVHRLPEDLANQIAAGEVVERPASVVKELVENALDAGAGRVSVDIEDAGRRLIRVVDDGYGMSRRDAALAVERHATSKVRSAADLQAIGTLGFRGEALPSIASVSRFALVTRTEEEVVGTEVRIDGGQVAELRDAGCPVGTRVEVRDLFYNVPARLKFLKQRATEAGHTSGLLTALALGYPHVHFRLTHGDRVVLDHPVAPSLEHRVLQVLGRAKSEGLYEVSLDGPVRVRGYISDPTVQRTNQQGVHAFVNGRAVRDRIISHALVSSYGNLLDRGRHPDAVLYIHLAPEDVDVNVHPAKAEVRFVRAGLVHEAVVRACRLTLAATPWLERDGQMALPRSREPSRTWAGFGAAGRGRVSGQPAAPQPAPQPSQVLVFEATGGSPGRSEPLDGQGAPIRRRGFFGRMRIVGQAARTYVICETDEALHVVDQHAAHERIAFERLKAAWAEAKVARQQLLFPHQLELTTRESQVLPDHAEALDRLGLSLEPFGGATWQVTAVPAILGRADPETLVRDVIAELVEMGTTHLGERHIERVLATMACHSVVRAGDALSEEEMRALLRSMDEVELGANCPHGRPVHFSLPLREIERRFHRS